MLAGLFGGCASDRIDPRIQYAADAGQYGVAREALQGHLTKDPSDRAYILDRLRLLILTLADGSPDAAEQVANQAYDLLRTQGLNDDNTVSAAVFNERVKIWKGEPFEQAMAYSYIAMQKAERGEWDNARAAAQNSLFLLKDFGDNERGGKKTAEDVAREAARRDKAGKSGDGYIDHGYTPVKTDFALGYLLSGLASKALGRDDEASDNFHEAENVNPYLQPLTKSLLNDKYNTVFVVDAGVGPRKVAYGPDDALVRFVPVYPSDGRTLRVSAAGGVAEYPIANDLNVMAADLQWNNLEDVRQAKSAIGDVLLVGGIAAATVPGGRNESSQARTNRALIGAGVALLGAALKASASADTRYCEFLPQRVYVVPVMVAGPDSVVTLSVGGDPGQTITLNSLSPPENRPLQLRYVRLSPRAGAWQTAGALAYANDATEARVPGDGLPYIMGGTCCRSPTSATLLRYQGAGHLRDMTAVDLENLYREEGITFTVEDQRGASAAHILEGGTSMVMPLAGTAGYERLFGQPHEGYVPKTDALRQAIAKETGRRSQ
ncbi:MAG: hypothetical protein WC718_11100 [Phycisphaerales bacterium]|jgi:hypothetical protein